MEEKRYDKIEENVPSPTILQHRSEKWDNFWYYYKWHVIVGIAVILLVVICAVQIFSRKNYDSYIIYAGPYEVERTSENNDTPMYSVMISSLDRLVGDINGDGEVLVSFKDLFIMLSEEEIKEIESKSEGRETVNRTLVQENNKTLGDLIVTTYDKYYISFLSTEIYESYKNVNGVYVFDKLTEYTQGIEGVEMYDERAIYLNSVAASELSGLSELPEDTVIVIKSVSDAAKYWNEKNSTKAHDEAVEILIRMLNYK